MLAGNDRAADGEEVAGGQTVGYDRCESLPEQVGDVVQRLPVGRDGRRALSAEDRPRRANDAEWSEAAVVDRDVWIGHSHEQRARARVKAGHRAVDGTRNLFVRTRKVANELVVRDRHLDPHSEGPVAYTVVVDQVLGLVD